MNSSTYYCSCEGEADRLNIYRLALAVLALAHKSAAAI